MSYLNKAQKEALISLGGVTSFCEELATTEWIKDEADKEKLRQAHKLVMEVMENIESGMTRTSFGAFYASLTTVC